MLILFLTRGWLARLRVCESCEVHARTVVAHHLIVTICHAGYCVCQCHCQTRARW